MSKTNSFLHFLTVLIVLILSSDYNQAREIKNTNNVLTLDLIHHDSLHLPKSSSRGKAPWGKVSPRHIIHLSSSPVFSKKASSNTVDVELTPDDIGSEYLIKLAIGTPPVEFMAVPDTGSNLIWLQCLSCQTSQTCVSQNSPLFDPSASTSYNRVLCTSSLCNRTQTGILSGCSSNNTDPKRPCLYFQSYADNTNTTGFLSTDTITFPSTDNSSSSDSTPEVTLSSTVFGCGVVQNGNFSNAGSIVGLGTGPLSLVSQLGQNKFSYCLVPRSSGATSKLKFGAEVTSPDVVSTPVVASDIDVYPVVLDEVSVGNSTFAVGANVIVDSGTTLTWLETSIYNAIKEVIKSSIPLDPLSDPAIDPLLCYQTRETLNPPEVVFHFKGADVVLKPVNLFRDILGEFKCLAMGPTAGSLFLFGNVAQINFEVGYDLENKQISFAPKDCATF